MVTFCRLSGLDGKLAAAACDLGSNRCSLGRHASFLCVTCAPIRRSDTVASMLRRLRRVSRCCRSDTPTASIVHRLRADVSLCASTMRLSLDGFPWTSLWLTSQACRESKLETWLFCWDLRRVLAWTRASTLRWRILCFMRFCAGFRSAWRDDLSA